jgi:polysaccharide export outer membrane protein
MTMTRPAAVTLAATVIGFLLCCGQLACQEGGLGSAVPSATGTGRFGAGPLEGTVDPGQYVLGPGDVLSIGFWGDVGRSERVVVNPDGDALVQPVGPLRVTGMTLADARKLITDTLAPYYRPGILSVSLVAIRSFQVHVVGMVMKPGALEANAVTRVSQAIGLAGGLAENASDRNIRLMRQGDTLRVDLTRYLLLGDNSINPFLNDGDVVYVPPRYESVQVFGSVYRQGPYEFTEGETLRGLLELAGGLRPEALTDSIEMARFRPDDPASSETIVLPMEPSVVGGFRMVRGDRVFVRSIPDWHRGTEATILGEVKYPGTYLIDEGVETLSHLITRAGGLTENASLAEARLVRGLYASRTFPIETEMDSVRIAESQLSEREIALVQTLTREPKGAVSIDFENLYDAGKRRIDPVLYAGDVITIPRASLAVRVSGQVKYPGLVPFKPGASISYYIGQAGGFASGADSWGVRVVTALNGQMLSPSGTQVRPGDMVWVPRKKDVGAWSAVKDFIQVLAQVATIYIVVDQIATK